jgi:hypothetical protein
MTLDIAALLLLVWMPFVMALGLYGYFYNVRHHGASKYPAFLDETLLQIANLARRVHYGDQEAIKRVRSINAILEAMGVNAADAWQSIRDVIAGAE